MKVLFVEIVCEVNDCVQCHARPVQLTFAMFASLTNTLLVTRTCIVDYTLENKQKTAHLFYLYRLVFFTVF